MQLVEGGFCRARELADDGGRGDLFGAELNTEDIVFQGVGWGFGVASFPVAVAPVLLLAVCGAVGARFAACTPQRPGVGAAGAAASLSSGVWPLRPRRGFTIWSRGH